MILPNDINEIQQIYRDNGLCEELVDKIVLDGGMLLMKHPLINEPISSPDTEPYWKTVNDIKNKVIGFHKELTKTNTYCEFLNKKLEIINSSIRESIDEKDWGRLCCWVPENQLWSWFMNNHFDLDDDGYFYLLKEMWVLDEQLSNPLDWYDVYEITELFTYRGNPQRIMSDEDLEGFNQLDDELTLYRGIGVGKGEVLNTDIEDIGISFTTDKEKGIWFGKRFSKIKTPHLLEITINKEDVFFYTNDRKENEVVINPLKIKSIKDTRLEMDE